MKCLAPECGKTCRTPKAPNWKLWQLCYLCALIAHPDYYDGKHKHGVGGTWIKQLECIPMTTPTMKN